MKKNRIVRTAHSDQSGTVPVSRVMWSAFAGRHEFGTGTLPTVQVLLSTGLLILLNSKV